MSGHEMFDRDELFGEPEPDETFSPLVELSRRLAITFIVAVIVGVIVLACGAAWGSDTQPRRYQVKSFFCYYANICAVYDGDKPVTGFYGCGDDSIAMLERLAAMWNLRGMQPNDEEAARNEARRKREQLAATGGRFAMRHERSRSENRTDCFLTPK